MASVNETAIEEFNKNYDYYWLKYTMERGVKEKAQILLVGNSLARFGINDSDIPGLINLSSLSQDYYYSSKIIENALEQIPSLKYVVLGTSYISAFSDVSKSSDPVDNCGGSDLADVYESIKDNYFSSGRSRQSLCDIVWTDPMTDDERLEKTKVRTDLHNSFLKNLEAFDENSAVLQKISAMCREKEVCLMMIVFPANMYYRDSLDPQLKDMYFEQLKSIPVGTIFRNLDLSESRVFDPVLDYADTEHLNDAGAEKMTELLGRFISDDRRIRFGE